MQFFATVSPLFQVERGLSWEHAKEKWSDLVNNDEGFYISHQVLPRRQPTIGQYLFFKKSGQSRQYHARKSGFRRKVAKIAKNNHLYHWPPGPKRQAHCHPRDPVRQDEEGRREEEHEGVRRVQAQHRTAGLCEKMEVGFLIFK
jgi:hypothetical protein